MLIDFRTRHRGASQAPPGASHNHVTACKTTNVVSLFESAIRDHTCGSLRVRDAVDVGCAIGDVDVVRTTDTQCGVACGLCYAYLRAGGPSTPGYGSRHQ